MSGGTVLNTADHADAVVIYTGFSTMNNITVEISGGTVGAMDTSNNRTAGSAILGWANNLQVTISQAPSVTTLITSASAEGTIYMGASSGFTAFLTITGGRVENTGSGRAIRTSTTSTGSITVDITAPPAEIVPPYSAP